MTNRYRIDHFTQSRTSTSHEQTHHCEIEQISAERIIWKFFEILHTQIHHLGRQRFSVHHHR